MEDNGSALVSNSIFLNNLEQCHFKVDSSKDLVVYAEKHFL